MAMLLLDFGSHGIIFMNERVFCYYRCHGNTVKGVWNLWDNTDGRVFPILYFPVVLVGKSTS
jgi:hypothetical protein